MLSNETISTDTAHSSDEARDRKQKASSHAAAKRPSTELRRRREVETAAIFEVGDAALLFAPASAWRNVKMHHVRPDCEPEEAAGYAAENFFGVHADQGKTRPLFPWTPSTLFSVPLNELLYYSSYGNILSSLLINFGSSTCQTGTLRSHLTCFDKSGH